MRKQKVNCFNVESVIEQRLNLDTVRRQLSSIVGKFFLSWKECKAANFAKIYKAADDNTKNKFAHLLGGSANFEATKQFLQTL